MIYIVKPGDALYRIAQKFNTTVYRILQYNAICNPNLIYPGQLLFIPTFDDAEFPKVGGGQPYYIIKPGDSLWCVANLFPPTRPSRLIELNKNKLENPNLIYPGTEILFGYTLQQPEYIKNRWENPFGKKCEELTEEQIHSVYYHGSFLWEALGEEAIPDLLEYLNHPCDTIRYYSVISLGRIAPYDEKVRESLKILLYDTNESVAEAASIVLNRMDLINKFNNKRIHLTVNDTTLYTQPKESPIIATLPKGAEIIVLTYRIPSIEKELIPAGYQFQEYDYVQIIRTGQIGFLRRGPRNEILFV